MLNLQYKIISDETKDLIRRLLLETLSLKGAVPPEGALCSKKIRKNEPHRRCEVYSTAKDKPPCTEDFGFLEGVCKSY